jgi:hypothetical protein
VHRKQGATHPFSWFRLETVQSTSGRPPKERRPLATRTAEVSLVGRASAGSLRSAASMVRSDEPVRSDIMLLTCLKVFPKT